MELLNVGALKSGQNDTVLTDIEKVVDSAHEAGAIVKVIFETDFEARSGRAQLAFGLDDDRGHPGAREVPGCHQPRQTTAENPDSHAGQTREGPPSRA